MIPDLTSEITFRKLSIFMTFMETGNIARAAEVLNLSGVSVHRALHTLEENVRCPLFTHKGRNLIALPAAWTLLEYCQEVMQVMERGLEEARKTAGIGQGRLRVGTLYSLTLETVPQLIMGMKLRRPDLEMDLTMGSNETLLHMLEEGLLDAILISISESEIDRNNLEVLPLFHDDICLAAPPRRSSIPTRWRIYVTTKTRSLSPWRKVSPPTLVSRRRFISPDLSRRSSPGLMIFSRC